MHSYSDEVSSGLLAAVLHWPAAGNKRRIRTYKQKHSTYSFVEDVADAVDEHERRLRLVHVVGHGVDRMQVGRQGAGDQQNVRLQLGFEHLAQIRTARGFQNTKANTSS